MLFAGEKENDGFSCTMPNEEQVLINFTVSSNQDQLRMLISSGLMTIYNYSNVFRSVHFEEDEGDNDEHE